MAKRGTPKKLTKLCIQCKQEKPLLEFYAASNPLTSSDGKKINICKNCIKEVIYTPDGEVNMERFKEVMQLLDKPFIPSVIDEIIKGKTKNKRVADDYVGEYMRKVGRISKYKKMSFAESLTYLEEEIEIEATDKPVSRRGKAKPAGSIYAQAIEDFEVTEEVVFRFGENYTKAEYCKLQRKYDRLAKNYQILTNLHEEALATYVRFKVKEEEATAKGDVTSASKWNNAAQDAADKAKLTPKQLTQSDLQGGINAISEIAKAVEEATDIIEILPRFKYAPNDAPDFIIWCYVNFCRKLKGLPEVDYSEVYSFYDRKKKEYIDQYGDPYGIFADDTSEKNRPNVEQFIELPKDYRE